MLACDRREIHLHVRMDLSEFTACWLCASQALDSVFVHPKLSTFSALRQRGVSLGAGAAGLQT